MRRYIQRTFSEISICHDMNNVVAPFNEKGENHP